MKRNRRGCGLILQGQGPCYVERLDPYGSAYRSGIRVRLTKHFPTAKPTFSFV